MLTVAIAAVGITGGRSVICVGSKRRGDGQYRFLALCAAVTGTATTGIFPLEFSLLPVF